MIVQAGELLICAHCGAGGEPADTLGVQLVRCKRCSFVFVSDEIEGDPPGSVLSLDDDPLTEKWGAVRSDRYHVERLLATGSQGRLLLARHRHLNQPCVIKLVACEDDLWADTAARRLRNEAQAGIRVNHPNVARVLDCDCVNQAWYFVMEYIHGRNLKQVLHRAGRLSPLQAAEIGAQAAAGLSAIHANNLVHRDIKPSNLMLSSGNAVKIMDLGLVKIAGAPTAVSLTHAGQVLGTPLYMPPEQFDAGDQVDARADIYALGATLFHLVTGHPVFDGERFKEVAAKHRRDPVRWTPEETDAVPDWLRSVIESCLAKRREHRIESAAALEATLREHRPPLPRTTAVSRKLRTGVAVLSFANTSRREDDDWIGDAIAEYLSSRLGAIDGVHVVDRNDLAELARQANAPETGSSGPDVPRLRESALFEAAKLAGVGRLVSGSFQKQGDRLRIIAKEPAQGDADERTIGVVSGDVANLFDLEDELLELVVQALGPALSGAKRRELQGSTCSLKANELYVRGRKAFAVGDYHAAIELAEQAAALDSEYDDAISLIGAANARLGNYDRAVYLHQERERRARDLDDPVSLAEALGNLGAMYYYKGDYAVAYDFLNRATQLSEQIDPTPDTAKLYTNLGMAVMRLDRIEDAERAFDRAIDICTEFNDIVSMVGPNNGMGTVLLKQERFTEAREFHERALAMAEKIKARVMVGVSQMNIGRCACLMKDFTESSIWFNAALGTLERTKFWNGLTLVYEYLADMHMMSDAPHEALDCIDKRIELAARHGNRRMESDAWEQKARAFEQMDQTHDALSAMKKSLAVSQQPDGHESLHRYIDDIATNRAKR